MTITREVTRADFVKQANGSTDWSIVITESAVDPFDATKVLKRLADPAPMTPEVALEKFDLSFTDVVSGINEAQALELAATKATLAQVRNELMQAQVQIAALTPTEKPEA